MATSTISTELDDLKDLAWTTHERLGYALDQLGGRLVDTEDEAWAFDEVLAAPYKLLAKQIPGLKIGNRGYPDYETNEAYRAVHTYDDGSPLVEHIKFDDAQGLSFHYRPRFDKPREEFLKWARAEADRYADDVHSRYVNVGGLGIEYTGTGDDAFSVHLGEDEHINLSRGKVFELRAGLTRILSKQARTDLHMGIDCGEEWADANEIHGNEGAIHLTTQIGPQFGVCIESFDSDGSGEVTMSLTEARHLAERLLALADGVENRYEEPVHPDAFRGFKEIRAENRARVPEILVALAAGVATPEQLANVVELPSGVCKTWAHVTEDELAELRRVHAF